jgi:hypothetical protein
MNSLLQSLCTLVINETTLNLGVVILSSSSASTPSSAALAYAKRLYTVLTPEMENESLVTEIISFTRKLISLEYAHFKSLMLPLFLGRINVLLKQSTATIWYTLDTVRLADEKGWLQRSSGECDAERAKSALINDEKENLVSGISYHWKI